MIFYLAHPVAPLPAEIAAVIADWRAAERSGAIISAIKLHDEDPSRAAARSIVRRNVDRALDWIRFLSTHTNMAIAAPWIPYVLSLDDTNPVQRIRGMRDSQAMARVCDGVFAAGGRTSSGMTLDVSAHREAKPPGLVVELHDLGIRPPVDADAPVNDFWRADMRRRIENAIATMALAL